MKRNDYIKLLASGLLQLPEQQFQKLADFISNRFEVHELYKVQSVSIAGITPGDECLGLIDWARQLRAEKIQKINAFYGTFSNVALEAHIATAFAGVEDVILNVITAAGSYFYILKVQYSPRNQMTPEQLVFLVNQQHDPVIQWKQLENILQKSNELNNKPRIAEGSLATYIVSPEGKGEFDWHAGDFIKELQLNALLSQQEFIIPESLKDSFQQSSFSFGDEGRSYTYLYPVSDVSAEELKLLISAQPFENEVWEKLIQYNKDYPSDSFPPYTTAKEWQENIHSIATENLTNIVHIGCRAICECCDEKGLKPVIPAALKDKLGPDEEETLRIEARSKLEKSEWFLAANNEPWELNLLQRVDYAQSISTSPSADELKNSFQRTLAAIESFARAQHSNFAEAFGLANYLLSDQVPSGSFDETHKERIIQALRTTPVPFSDRAVENFSNTFYFSEELLLMNWEASRIYGLFAISLADVFGGMGSWNDQYFESEEDNNTYQRLSAELFDALKKYWTTLISS